MKGPIAAPKLSKAEIQEDCSSDIWVSKGPSVLVSFSTIGDDHVNAVPTEKLTMLTGKKRKHLKKCGIHFTQF